jgi:hypothetical protein
LVHLLGGELRVHLCEEVGGDWPRGWSKNPGAALFDFE